MTEQSALPQNYDNIFPTKIIHYVKNADGIEYKPVIKLKYNRFGQITSIRVGNVDNLPEYNSDVEKFYQYYLLGRLQKEIYRGTVEGIYKELHKIYIYTPPTSPNSYASTTIIHKDAAGNGENKHITSFYYNGIGQLVETKKGPTNNALRIEKVTYDAFGRTRQVEDGWGIKTEYIYDGFDRNIRTNTFDNIGQLSAYQVFKFDDLFGKVVIETHSLAGGVDTLASKTVEWSDKSGNLVQIDQYPIATEM